MISLNSSTPGFVTPSRDTKESNNAKYRLPRHKELFISISMDVSQIRRNGSKDFITFYTSLCALQSSCPISNIKSCAKEGVLNCHLHSIDRLDLHPILTALRVNTVLHTVVFYNKWQEKAYHHYAGENTSNKCTNH